jgi:hypothetical protein
MGGGGNNWQFTWRCMYMLSCIHIKHNLLSTVLMEREILQNIIVAKNKTVLYVH